MVKLLPIFCVDKTHHTFPTGMTLWTVTVENLILTKMMSVVMLNGGLYFSYGVIFAYSDIKIIPTT